MLAWFKKHPIHLQKESTALSNDNNYQEIYQFRDKLFISQGNIIVRLNVIHRFPILIIYPDSTPYQLPCVYPINSIIPNNEIENLAGKSFIEAINFISNNVKYFYQFRHQNQTGNLCILEWDNLEGGSNFYSITSILKRVKDWFKGTLTNEFPPESLEVEYFAHFKKADISKEFLYPDKFLNLDILEGEGYAVSIAQYPPGKIYKEGKNIFLGVLLTGKNKGIFKIVDDELPAIFCEEGINNSLDLINKKEILERLEANNKLLKIYWFHIFNEIPNPFQTFSELITIIGSGDYNQGVSRMISICFQDLTNLPNYFYIALRFPDKKHSFEYQLFKIIKDGEETGVLVGDHSQFDKLIYLLPSYNSVLAIKSEKISDETLHLRNLGRINRQLLKKQIISMIGVGALGSEIADCMAKAGTGIINLIDNQSIRASNPIRHLAGFNQIGIPKTHAVANSLANHNLFIEARSMPLISISIILWN